MVTVLLGDEPYLMDCQINKLTKELAFPELNLMMADSVTEDVRYFLSTYPAMDDYKVFILKLSHLKELDQSFLDEFLKDTTTNRFVICATDYDAKSSYYKKMKGLNLITFCSKEEAAKALPSFLTKITAKKGASFEEDALNLFIERTGYVDNPSMNLYSMVGYIDSLIALNRSISKSMVEENVPAFYQENVFAIAKLLMNKDMEALRIQAELLKGNEIGTLSALLREFRISYKAKYFPMGKIGASYAAFLKKDKDYLVNGIYLLTDVIASIKKGTVCLSTCLFDTFLRLL